ncbi:MAG: phosphatase PAP2 family protein [Gammaproteobacteria bacterium]
MINKISLALLASAAAILWLGAYTDVDFALARLMYDLPSHSFPWRHSFFAEVLSHNVLRALMLVLAVLVAAPMAYDAWKPYAGLSDWWRERLRVVALSAVLVPLAVNLLKHLSASHCPWDLVDFGGAEHYVRLLQAAIGSAPAGHCMPAGHATSVLWLLSVVVFWLPHRPRTALTVGAGMLAAGFAVGWVQQMRGAHFLTHTLWSMWIASAIVSGLYGRMQRQHQAQEAEAVLT